MNQLTKLSKRQSSRVRCDNLRQSCSPSDPRCASCQRRISVPSCSARARARHCGNWPARPGARKDHGQDYAAFWIDFTAGRAWNSRVAPNSEELNCLSERRLEADFFVLFNSSEACGSFGLSRAGGGSCSSARGALNNRILIRHACY